MTDFSAAPPAPGAGDFSVGAVLKRSFSTYFANFIPFTILALIFYLPTLILGFLQLSDLESGVPSTDPTGEIVGGLVSFILTYILVGALVYGTVQHLGGERSTLGQIISRGMSTIGPVIVVALLLSLVIALGFILLIVPGVFLTVAYAVVIPAAVVERPGIIGAFKRSWELTKGYRWRVFGILLILLVIMFVFAFVVGAIGGFTAFTTESFTILILVNYLISAITGTVMSVMIAVIYHDLRVAKEGVSASQLAAVFD